ncbi:hypothetical protein AURDEDRAFT_131415 [Auricularia subglabra TFB-10046 SS5]|uniref:Uncharacterized protein n=1 Tax=Auricularia subglabra (strain TFB-10046 / SS5) TaxID=717982 RepID=J0CUH2_AURST|nr:hypothetical protein AURDEDRAFT_131415 [Auricularia subglabra TFB-10046 SS5]
MAKKQPDTVGDSAPPPRRSSRHAVAQVEEPVTEVAAQGRSSGRRTNARGANSTGVPASPAPLAKARGRPRRATQQDQDEGSPVARKSAGRRRNPAIPEELPGPPGQGEEAGESDGEGTEGQRKRPASSATRRRKARAAANARARAAEDAISNEEESNERGVGPDAGPIDSDRQSAVGAVDEDDVEEVEFVRKRATPEVEHEASQDESDAFVRPKKARNDGREQLGKGSAPKPARSAPDVEPGNALGRQHAASRGQARKDSGSRGQGAAHRDKRDVVEERPAHNDADAQDEGDERPKARRHTKAVQEELAEAARLSALEDLGSRMVGMLGQLKDAGIRLDFAGSPVQFAAAPAEGGDSTAARSNAATSPVKGRSRADNFKGDGSSREGKPVTEGRRYGAVWGSYDDFDVGLNISDYSRKNNDAPRDNTELFYPVVRKHGEKGKERAVEPRTPAREAAVPRGEQHGEQGKERGEQHGEKGKERAVDPRTPARTSAVTRAGQNSEKAKERAVDPRTPARTSALPRTPDVGQKRKRLQDDDGDEERPIRQVAGGRPAGGSKNKAVKISDDLLHRRPLAPRNASTRVSTADAMDIDADV